MQKSYQNLTLIIGLLLAPFPLLIGLFIYCLITEPSLSNNYENNSYLKFMSSMLIFSYIFYTIVIAPFLLILLYFLNRFKRIHFFTLICIAYFSAILLSILGDYLKNYNLPNTFTEFKELLILNPIFIWTGSTAFTLWLFLKWYDYRNRPTIKA